MVLEGWVFRKVPREDLARYRFGGWAARLRRQLRSRRDAELTTTALQHAVRRRRPRD
jgi:hypothetical protein